MDNETVVAVSNIAETITSIGILLLWVWAERRDNHSLFGIIQALSSLRLRQIEREEKHQERIENEAGSDKGNS
jgi:hypothetical protein